MIAALTITLGWWLLPAALTVIFLIIMVINLINANKPMTHWLDFEGMFSFIAALLCLVPIGFVWAIYFALAYFLK